MQFKILLGMVLSLLLLTLPAEAADFTLGVFGNANGDETINMQDVTFTELIILEYNDATELADARYDSEIDILDVTQIELIILGREKELTLIDSSDRIITVQKPVERIATTHYSTAEGISLLGAWDRVVGRDQFTTNEVLFPGTSELPAIDGSRGCYDVNYEKVFELDPDIFLTTAVPYPGFEDIVNTLEPDIPVVALNFNEPHTLVENTKKLRYVLNTKEEGDSFIAFYEGVIDEIAKKTAELTDEDKPTVFFKTAGWDPEKISTFTDTKPLIRYQMEIAGGINIADEEKFGELEFVPEVDEEWLVEENPEIVVAMIWDAHNLGTLGYGIDDDSVAIATREEIMEMDAFAGGKAVNEGKVYLHHDELQLTPRYVVFIAYLAKWFHPELFEDLDPQAIHQEYLTDFMRIDYDLDEHGVFVYPEEPVVE